MMMKIGPEFFVLKFSDDDFQGRNGQFFAGKASTVAATSVPLPPLLFILQNPGKA
jgi:hypothetical protein